MNHKIKKISALLLAAMFLCSCGSEIPVAVAPEPTAAAGTADMSDKNPETGKAPAIEEAPAASPEPSSEDDGPAHEPGPYFEGVRLRYTDGSGNDVKGGFVGVLEFDEDGYFTSGDEELDAMLIEELEKNVSPETQSRIEMLEIMYDYLVWNFGYRFATAHEEGETGWEAEDAKYMLEKRKGNCYTYAALMAMFARSLGYQANGIAGHFRGGEHSWAEIEENGEYYICDAEYQACNDPYRSIFFRTYEEEYKNCYANPHE